jgi:AraC-like DNA-binding protein
MTLKYFDVDNVKSLVEELFLLKFTKEDIPFQSTVLPICNTSITYIYSDSQKAIYNMQDTLISGPIVTGQFYDSYQFLVNKASFSYGISLHPTALYKLTGLDIGKIKNKHVPLKKFDDNLYQLLNPIFLNNKTNISQLTKNLKIAILSVTIESNSIIDQIDQTIDVIHKKEGLLNTYDLLNYVSFSQKSLETHFKKIVGLTPGRYIRLYRFLKLMRKYEGKEINLNDLIYMYDYYDHSHFTKDFKYFMKQSPKDFFKSEHPFLNEYLNK